jgi:hypothetical protein
LSEDSSGFSAGDANLYRYVGNDSTNRTDPSGLIEVANYQNLEEPSSGTPVFEDIPECSPGQTKMGLFKTEDNTKLVFTLDCIKGEYVGTVVGNDAGKKIKTEVGRCLYHNGLNLIILGYNKKGSIVEIQWFNVEANFYPKGSYAENRKKLQDRFKEAADECRQDPDAACSKLRAWLDKHSYLIAWEAEDNSLTGTRKRALDYIWHRPSPDKVILRQLTAVYGRDAESAWITVGGGPTRADMLKRPGLWWRAGHLIDMGI